VVLQRTGLREEDSSALQPGGALGRKRSVRVAEVMFAELGSAAVRRMEAHGVMALPVKDDEKKLVGIVHLHDLMRSGAA